MAASWTAARFTCITNVIQTLCYTWDTPVKGLIPIQKTLIKQSNVNLD